MIMLDEPFVSETLLDWLEESQHAIVDNSMARRMGETRTLHLCPEDEAIARIDAGERLYTNSENTLAWIAQHISNESITHALAVFKDKALMREVLRPLDPDYFFKSCSAKDLVSLDFNELRVPFVLKPTVGFCSIGVYTITDESSWHEALLDVGNNASSWQEMYPTSVVGADSFVLEGYIEGTEYAIDAYFDASGQAHVLNVLRHDFASSSDTSDRLYGTSKSIIAENLALFTEWLDRLNELVGAKNFPVHVEVRVKNGLIRPIEINPLRFAGLGGTDISWFAYGFRTYEYFLENKTPQWDSVLAGKEDKVYTMSVLNVPVGMKGDEEFNYEQFRARFTHVLCLREFDYHDFGNFGFLFMETDEQNISERSFLLNSDLEEFIG